MISSLFRYTDVLYTVPYCTLFHCMYSRNCLTSSRTNFIFQCTHMFIGAKDHFCSTHDCLSSKTCWHFPMKTHFHSSVRKSLNEYVNLLKYKGIKTSKSIQSNNKSVNMTRLFYAYKCGSTRWHSSYGINHMFW